MKIITQEEAYNLYLQEKPTELDFISVTDFDFTDMLETRGLIVVTGENLCQWKRVGETQY